MSSELRSVLSSSLSRIDQRHKAEQYLRGLLFAEGRKSIRNIAALSGGSAAEQSLHHFISSSTWEWRPMRRALARLLERVRPPEAWVLQSLPIPKAGRHSVGVERHFVPELGQTMNGQQAFGLWLAASELSVPVSWRLFLPHTWTKDMTKRRRGEIPDCAPEETVEECAISTVLDAAYCLGIEPRPVLLDARATGFAMAARRLGAAGLPLLAQVEASTRLVVADPALPGYGGGAFPAQRVVESVRSLQQPVLYADPATGTMQTAFMVTVKVDLPPSGPGRPGPLADTGRRQAGGRPLRDRDPAHRRGDRATGTLLLLGEWDDTRRPPSRLWLTDMTDTPGAALLRITKLARRVAWDFMSVGDQVGLRHFTGRSFHGWHRHMTLASIAHAARMLERTDRVPAQLPPQACGRRTGDRGP